MGFPPETVWMAGAPLHAIGGRQLQLSWLVSGFGALTFQGKRVRRGDRDGTTSPCHTLAQPSLSFWSSSQLITHEAAFCRRSLILLAQRCPFWAAAAAPLGGNLKGWGVDAFYSLLGTCCTSCSKQLRLHISTLQTPPLKKVCLCSPVVKL